MFILFYLGDAKMAWRHLHRHVLATRSFSIRTNPFYNIIQRHTELSLSLSHNNKRNIKYSFYLCRIRIMLSKNSLKWSIASDYKKMQIWKLQKSKIFDRDFLRQSGRFQFQFLLKSLRQTCFSKSHQKS